MQISLPSFKRPRRCLLSIRIYRMICIRLFTFAAFQLNIAIAPAVCQSKHEVLSTHIGNFFCIFPMCVSFPPPYIWSMFFSIIPSPDAYIMISASEQFFSNIVNGQFVINGISCSSFVRYEISAAGVRAIFLSSTSGALAIFLSSTYGALAIFRSSTSGALAIFRSSTSEGSSASYIPRYFSTNPLTTFEFNVSCSVSYVRIRRSPG